MLRVNRFFFTIFFILIIVYSTKQSHVRYAKMAFKAIDKTIKSPIFKTIGDTIKKPIIKTFSNTINNSVGMFRRNKNTIKNIAPLVNRECSRIVRTGYKKNNQMIRNDFSKFVTKSAELMKGKEVSSLINMVSKSKPQLPLLFVTGGFGKLAQFNLVAGNDEAVPSIDEVGNNTDKVVPKIDEVGGDAIEESSSNSGNFDKRLMGNNKDIIELARKHMMKQGFSDKPIPEEKPDAINQTDKDTINQNVKDTRELNKSDANPSDQNFKISTSKKTLPPPKEMPTERVSKYLSRAGVCSRREAERMMAEGLIKVNGKVLNKNMVINPKVDKVSYIQNGVEKFASKTDTKVWLFHKPMKMMCDERDPKGRESIFEYIRGTSQINDHIISVGRLDYNSEGLMVLTNNGELARNMELPASNILRQYSVRVYGYLDDRKMRRIRQGCVIEGVKYGPFECHVSEYQNKNTWLQIGLRQGKNREIRRVMEHNDLMVSQIRRNKYGPYTLDGLNVGEVRQVQMTPEIQTMLQKTPQSNKTISK